MRRSIPLFVAAVAGLGCGAPDSSPDIVYDPCTVVGISPGVPTSPAQRDGLVAAIGLWRDVGLTSLTLEPGANDQRLPVHFKDAPDVFHGVYEPSNGEVRVNSRMADRALDVTLAHEIGHALGLAHVPLADRVSVMNPGNDTVVPTADDEKQLQLRWSCLPRH